MVGAWEQNGEQNFVRRDEEGKIIARVCWADKMMNNIGSWGGLDRKQVFGYGAYVTQKWRISHYEWGTSEGHLSLIDFAYTPWRGGMSDEEIALGNQKNIQQMKDACDRRLRENNIEFA